MAQNTEELNENAEELTSYTSESSDSAQTAVKERPALTVAGSAVGRRKQAIVYSRCACPTSIGLCPRERLSCRATWPRGNSRDLRTTG